MIKAYTQWLLERNLEQPITVEYDAGKIQVYADPEVENWAGESIRLDYYKDLLGKLKSALKTNDDDSLTKLLSEIRDLPLFGQDKSVIWKAVQINGIEHKKDQAKYRLSCTMYAIKKIESFIDWVLNKK